jgi:ABC-type spermidine/putrescine transport systems, ATPase components
MVFQEGALLPHMTARKNIEYAATSTDRVDELATVLELKDVLERKSPTLSGGERQRVALARTLATDPDVLLLDEPLSSLDAPIRKRLRDELHSLFESLEIQILYVTHDQRTATALGDRVAIVRDGDLEQVG